PRPAWMPSSRSWIDRLAGKELSLNFKRDAATLILGLVCGAVQVQAAAPPPAAIAPLQLKLAVKAAKAAMAACVKEGLTVTVTVTDREGVARVVLLGDRTGALGVITS